MKRLRFKTPFNGMDNALKLIPESYKVNGKEFELTDGIESYRVRWEKTPTILTASNKNLMNEDMQKMKHLMQYNSKDTLGNLRGKERINENKVFNDVWGKTKKLIKEGWDDEPMKFSFQDKWKKVDNAKKFASEFHIDPSSPLVNIVYRMIGENENYAITENNGKFMLFVFMSTANPGEPVGVFNSVDEAMKEGDDRERKGTNKRISDRNDKSWDTLKSLGDDDSIELNERNVDDEKNREKQKLDHIKKMLAKRKGNEEKVPSEYQFTPKEKDDIIARLDLMEDKKEDKPKKKGVIRSIADYFKQIKGDLTPEQKEHIDKAIEIMKEINKDNDKKLEEDSTDGKGGHEAPKDKGDDAKGRTGDGEKEIRRKKIR